MTKRIISLILSLVLLFSTTIPAFASDDLTDISNEADQAVEETSNTTDEEEIFEIEDNEPVVEEHEEEKNVVEDPKNDVADVEDSKDKETDVEASEDGKTDVEESEQGEAGEVESPEMWEDAVDAPADQLDMPKISKLTSTPEGVEITWNAVSGAKNYRVLLLEKSGEWKKLADTDATSYIWTGAQEGVFYVFSVRCISSDGESYTSDFDEAGMGIVYTVAELENEQTEVGKPEDDEAEAEEHEEGLDENVASMLGQDDAVLKIEDLVNEDAKALSESVATIAYALDTPGSFRLINTPEGMAISWAPVKGAAKYRVFYKVGSGNWTTIADTTDTSYRWTGAQVGYNYVFTVRCVSADGTTYTSDFDPNGINKTYVPTQLTEIPELRQNDEWIKSTPEGVKLTWGSVLGAAKYRVFYKTQTSGWSPIADTTDTSYTWSGAKGNVAYSFTVRCVTSDGTGYTSGFDTAGVSIVYNAAAQYDNPKVNKPVLTSEGVTISWDKVPDAKKYRVFYKYEGTGWKALIDTTGTSYTWTGGQDGVTYTFTVRCVSADGSKYTSGFYPGESITYNLPQLDTPQLSSVTSAPNGVVIAWNAVPSAQKYRIFYKIGNGGWTPLVDTTATSYTWTGAQSGTKYTFTVRCVSANGSKYTSSFNPTGMSLTYVPAQFPMPMLSSVSNTSKGVAISWEEVPGAAKYRVFYKTDSIGWTVIADTTAHTYVWLGAEENVRYTFTVRCLDSNGSYASSFDATGLSILYRPTEYSLSNEKPGDLQFENSQNGLVIYWDAVTGAEKYRLFLKKDGAWTALADTTATSYTWTGAKSGESYTFTLRCVSADGKTYTSSFNPDGWPYEYQKKNLGTPTNLKVASAPAGAAISWDAVPGAQKYRVFYKYEGIGWKSIADTTDTSYMWSGALSGITYTFTVRCVSLDGATYTSDFKESEPLKYQPGQLGTPKGITTENTKEVPNRVKITWEAVDAAAKYRVFYKTATSSWTKIADTASTEYTWTEAEGDTTYYFTVRCISADGKTYTSGCESPGAECVIAALETPEVNGEILSSNGNVKISWRPIAGAYKYRVFYKNITNNLNNYQQMDWTPIADITPNGNDMVSYEWIGARPNNTYIFTVRCLSYDASRYTSAEKESKQLKIPTLKTPGLTSVANVSGGVQITWNPVAGAQKYRVFYKTATTNWSAIADITSTKYTWTAATPGTTYTFTVRCVSADGSTYTSDFDKKGLTITTWNKNLSDIIAGGTYQQAKAAELLEEINNMRGNELSLAALVEDEKLVEIAKQRAAEFEIHYGETRPDSSESYTSLVYNGVTSKYELRSKCSSATEVYEDLYNYLKNLDKRYTNIGIACFEYRGQTYWAVELN